MTSLKIKDELLPNLIGKVAIVTGGASGIGLAAAKILVSKHAKVHIIDLNFPNDDGWHLRAGVNFWRCDVRLWSELRSIFDRIGHVNMVFANAGISESISFLTDTHDENGSLQEPSYDTIDVNVIAAMNTVKLGWNSMKRQGTGGAIVVTTSATAYAPEQSLPVYSAGKLALVGLVRALRSTAIKDNVTINAVAPAATITDLLPKDLASPIIAAGLPVSSAHFVGLALVHSATAMESTRVEAYGKDKDAGSDECAPWNGRVILTLGDTYTELEEGIAGTRRQWFGSWNTEVTRAQQAATDFRYQ